MWGQALDRKGRSFSQKAHVVRVNLNVIDKEHFAGAGFFGSIFAGYQWIKNQYFLAGELNANLSSLQYKLVNDEYFNSTISKTTFKIRNSEGISLLPGYFLAPHALAYARIGYVSGHLKINESDPTISNFNTHLNGIRYGLGMRYEFSERWQVMLDYSQINYSSVKSHVFEPNGGVLKDTKITSNTAQVGFGILYHFA